MRSAQIALVGMACRFADAQNPRELWENVLAQRRAFRRIPAERLPLEEYGSQDREEADLTYATQAAVIEDYHFDRVRFRVSGRTFRSVDLTHWLALDVGAQALGDAGFPEGKGLPRQRTGVIVGNSLAGEFSRANSLRLRWPYVRKVLRESLHQLGWSERAQELIHDLERRFKAPFPVPNEESLAGGLSNTIAGRICNHFDLGGGGYSVDGACASSLLAVCTGCNALASGDLDAVLAGGVDLSLDPFELVGFARTGALAGDSMKVYDEGAEGFWPGEGCAFVTLMRLEDAQAADCRIYALLKGWGVSSDGRGGITRPEAHGQQAALRRAYRRAGFALDTVAYFEGHGTGTPVGDGVEIEALSKARQNGHGRPAVIGSLKANLGHTKAASGVAGLIKAALAVHEQVLPAATACPNPLARLGEEESPLKTLEESCAWPKDMPIRAGVSALGFGGVNTHVALEAGQPRRPAVLSGQARLLNASYQDCELFLASAATRQLLRGQVEELLSLSGSLSLAEMTDLSCKLAAGCGDEPFRMSLVAANPEQLRARLERLLSWISEGGRRRSDPGQGLMFNCVSRPPRILFLFPGQASPINASGGCWIRRFEFYRNRHREASRWLDANGVQPAVVAQSLAGLCLTRLCGLKADAAVGHSLGEISALCWAGSLGRRQALNLAQQRSRLMRDLVTTPGGMAGVAAPASQIDPLIEREGAVIACYNAAWQTVISGSRKSLERAADRLRSQGMTVLPIPVSHAFHSPLMAAVEAPLRDYLGQSPPSAPRRPLFSTVLGRRIGPDDDLSRLLCGQLTQPVRFMQALEQAGEADLLLEVGPGQVLSRILKNSNGTPAFSLDVGGKSVQGVLSAVGAAYALGAGIKLQPLFKNRFSRPFKADRPSRFLVNPCQAPAQPRLSPAQMAPSPEKPETRPEGGLRSRRQGALGVVQALVGQRSELPPSAIDCDHRFLSDLHMNSLSVAELLVEASRRLDLPAPLDPTQYANASLAEAARGLTEQEHGIEPHEPQRAPNGLAFWLRTFKVEWVESPQRPPSRQKGDGAGWQIFSGPGLKWGRRVEELLQGSSGGGVVACLPPKADRRAFETLLRAAQAVEAAQPPRRFIVACTGDYGAAFARSLHLELTDCSTCAVQLPQEHPRAAQWLVREAQSCHGHREVRYDSTGRRSMPVLSAVHDLLRSSLPIGQSDLVLVSGGGKGIGAECALSLARETGCRLAVLGRSERARSRELEDNLERLEASGIRYRYENCDVTDKASVKSSLARIEADLGRVTAILHCAGINQPSPLRGLTLSRLESTVAVKVTGARNLLEAVEPGQLRLLVTFGSLIGRTGLSGEAHYALANECLSALAEQWQEEHPACRCLALEWSVWSGLGMGERLGRIEALSRQGIHPIPPDEGTRYFLELLQQEELRGPLLVTSRFGQPPTVKFDTPPLPFHRFLEKVRVHYPGVELVADMELSTETDPYLSDHSFKGQPLFPAVMGLEAMAQAAMALDGQDRPPRFERVRFRQPIWLSGDQPAVLRLAALKREKDLVEVALQCRQSDFKVNHFSALCRFPSAEEASTPPDSMLEQPPLSQSPATDLYGKLFFQQGRFRRVRGYRRLHSKYCLAEINAGEGGNWFSSYLPSSLVLGNPGVRDAAIHAIQGCIPHWTVLPVEVDKIEAVRLCPEDASTLWAEAVESREEKQSLTYDLEIKNAQSQCLERWTGLRLRKIEKREWKGALPVPLVAPFFERSIAELVPGAAVSISLEKNDRPRRERTRAAIRRACNNGRLAILYRPDGKPEAANGKDVSSSHGGDLTLGVAGAGPLACDIQRVRQGLSWKEILGPENMRLAQFAARELEEGPDRAASRVWTAIECLKKAGTSVLSPLTLEQPPGGDWVLFGTGALSILTWAMQIPEAREEWILAILVRKM